MTKDMSYKVLHRRLTRLTLGLVALYVTYLALGNLLLNSQTGRELANREPEKFVASWGTAWTLFPGQLHATDLRLEGHVRRVLWSVQADSASGRVALLPLLAKEVRVPRVDAAGVRGGANLSDTELVPPPPRPGGWTLRFDRIVAEGVDRAWFDDVVLAGKGRAEVGFVKVLRGGAMQVLPSRASFTQARVSRKGTLLARDATVDARFAIDRHLREEAPGIRKLEKADLDVSIAAATAGLSIESRQGAKPVLRLNGESGRVEGRIAWKHGTLEPGGKCRLEVPVQEDLAGKLQRSVAAATFEVAGEELRLAANFSPAAAADLRANADLRLRGRTIPLADMRALAARTSGHAVANWHFGSLAWLAELLPSSHLVSFDGAGTVLADLTIADGEVAPGSVLEVPHVAAVARALGNRFYGDASARIRFEAQDRGRTKANLAAVMHEFQVSAEDEPDKPYVRGHDLRIEAIAHDPLGELTEHLEARLRFENAVVPDLSVYNRYLPRTNLRMEGGAGTLGGDLFFDSEGNVGRGELSVAGKSVRLSLAGLQLEGDIAIDTKLERADLDTHRFNADGSRVVLQGVRVLADDGPRQADWWSEIALDKARLDWDRPMTLDAQLRVHMKDLGPLLDVYSQRKDLPGWVQGLVDAGEATAQGRVQWQGDTLLLQPFEASNERFDVLARLRMEQKELGGELFARWGVLSMGVGFADGKRDLHLVDARDWYDGQAAQMPPQRPPARAGTDLGRTGVHEP
jgi:hypothetical protein